MNCHPGAIPERFSMKGYKRRHERTGESYNKRKRKRAVCPLPACGKDLALGSLQSYLCTQHGMDTSGSIIIELEALLPCLYKLSYIQQSDHSQYKMPCPVEDYCYTASITANVQ